MTRLLDELPSIRGRLTGVLIVVALIWGLAIATAVSTVTIHQVDKLLDSALEESSEILQSLIGLNLANGEFAQQDLPVPAHEERLVWQVMTDDGRLLNKSASAPDNPLSTPQARGLGTSASAEWRTYSAALGKGGYILHVAQREAERHDARFAVTSVVAFVALVIGFGSAYWLRHRIESELRPLLEFSGAVARFNPLADEPGSRKLGPASREELKPVHAAVVELGDRLGQLVASERAFAAHAAHALRTPLAGMNAQLTVAIRDCPPEVQPRLLKTREAAARLSRVVTAILSLFRASSTPSLESVDLEQLVQRLPFDQLAITVEAGQKVLADPDLLAAALVNMFENSARHHASKVLVRVMQDESSTRIQVTDNGSGMTSATIRYLQHSLDSKRYEGQLGLGLTLADLVARAHGGGLELLQNEGGASMQLILKSASISRCPARP
jgi:two-component system OmpR family sensor kinase